jgi:hypothetical protein
MGNNQASRVGPPCWAWCHYGKRQKPPVSQKESPCEELTCSLGLAASRIVQKSGGPSLGNLFLWPELRHWLCMAKACK